MGWKHDIRVVRMYLEIKNPTLFIAMGRDLAIFTRSDKQTAKKDKTEETP